jgi:hypothetical protein
MHAHIIPAAQNYRPSPQLGFRDPPGSPDLHTLPTTMVLCATASPLPASTFIMKKGALESIPMRID